MLKFNAHKERNTQSFKFQPHATITPYKSSTLNRVNGINIPIVAVAKALASLLGLSLPLIVLFSASLKEIALRHVIEASGLEMKLPFPG